MQTNYLQNKTSNIFTLGPLARAFLRFQVYEETQTYTTYNATRQLT